MNDDTTNKPPEGGLEEPENALPGATLESLPPKMHEAAVRAGWTRLMPVQEKTIPYFLARRDLMVQSRTGSGKTGAFVLPIIERIDPSRPVCQALVLTPTRELARQVAQEAEMLSGGETRVVAVYGGVGYGAQMEGFKLGAHLVVGTPGRILDHLLRRSLSLENLEILIFDEADRMLSMGFYPDMRQVQRYLPQRPISAYMFSATFPARVISLARQFLHEPETLSLSKDHVHVSETEHVFYSVPPMEKDRALVRIIEIENPDSAFIFCNTKQQVHYVSVVLQRFGYDADELSADLNQSDRERVMERIRKGKLRFMVATDVAARGIDIPELSHVILYEPPDDPEAYIHRAGRTGRAGAGGVAISLVAGAEELELRRIGKRFTIDFEERKLPSDEDVEAVVAERVTSLLEARLRDRDRLHAERAKRFIPLARNLAQSEEESTLIAMLLDDYYQETLHGLPLETVEDRKKQGEGGPKRGINRGEGGADRGTDRGGPEKRTSGGGRRRRSPGR